MKKCVKRHAIIQPLDQSYRLIGLTQGQNAIVDAGDYEWLNGFNWHAIWNPHTKSFYAKRRVSHGKIISMQAFILGCKAGGDHKNHNTLDNRRDNIRKCTATQNQYNLRKRRNNTSGYKGVSWDKQHGKWAASIKRNGRKTRLGLFDILEEAARAYDEAAKTYYGEFSCRNFSS